MINMASAKSFVLIHIRICFGLSEVRRSLSSRNDRYLVLVEEGYGFG